MSTIKHIEYADIVNSTDIYHFGWDQDELASLKKQYQSNFYGNAVDARFEITDDVGNIHYAIFRASAKTEYLGKQAQDFLLFKDQNRVLLNISGKLYRYLINERKILDISVYAGVIYNDSHHSNSPYLHSITSSNAELMVIVDCEGIAAINWDKVLWKHQFDLAYCGNLRLVSIEDHHVTAVYENFYDAITYSISFELFKGTYNMKSNMGGL